MAIHQVEEYYVRIDISKLSDKEEDKIKSLLVDSNFEDYQVVDGFLLVNYFESESDAMFCDDLINDYLTTCGDE